MKDLFASLRRIAKGIQLLGPALVLQAGLYPLRKAYHTARFDAAGRRRSRLQALRHTLPALRRARRPDPPPADQFTFPGALRDYRRALSLNPRNQELVGLIRQVREGSIP